MRMRKNVVVLVSTSIAVVVVGALIRKWKQWKEQQLRHVKQIIRKFARESATPLSKLWQVADDMVSSMKISLASSDESPTLNMVVSNVASLPLGDEEGFFYGVSLYGRNLLMLCARLGGKKKPISALQRQDISIPDAVLAGPSLEITDYIATEIAKFVSMHPEIEIEDSEPVENKKFGFTLSYPVHQAMPFSDTASQHKNANNPVRQGMVKDLNRALATHGMTMPVVSLVDETIGGLAGGRYYNRESVAAVTLGTTTNAAYVEPAEEVASDSAQFPNSSELVISMEWGNFNSLRLPLTSYDASVDAESSNPGSQVFEKLISGKYLGEVVRHVLLKLAKETALFGSTVPPKLMIPYLIRPSDMAAMHQDTSEDREIVGEKLGEIFEIHNCCPMAREAVAEVCDIVAERGARLAGAGIVGIIKKLGRIKDRKSVVTVEGELYEHYRIFRNYLHSSVWQMLGKDFSDNVIIEHSHGGSGTGALFLAAAQTQAHHSDY
ncbi:probable hexokinase-like 2 protein [Vigna unguiculata]|uniref:probable hexokinase-like 2 protein n=1 Tax=Vigna unguiculata TaxID=3917 RepID=UPI001015CDDD|nr:probable hexokinase-like 2 protein [Vigna unguiculata]